MELIVYDSTLHNNQITRENDYNDPIHWYNGVTFDINETCDEIRKRNPSDAIKILEYITNLTYDKIKEQDHYLILGLDHLRYRATDNQIKTAYRKACLLFHPDKHDNQFKLNHSQFVHITKAYEILSDHEKRQSYDSVDSEFDNSIPSIDDLDNNFYQIFGAAFYRNARWSIEQPVPLLGNEDTSYRHAQKFYNFWRNFRSKREFSYLDEQPVEDGECREERRYLTKLNKKKREQHKKDEIKRIKQLIENCRICDPRIPKFVQIKTDLERINREEKKRRQQLKKASKYSFTPDIIKSAITTSIPEIEIVKNEVKQPTIDMVNSKNEKKLYKQQLNDQQNILRKYIESHNYFTKKMDSNKLENIEKFDKFIKLIKLEDLQELNQQLDKLSDDFDACLQLYSSQTGKYIVNKAIDPINIQNGHNINKLNGTNDYHEQNNNEMNNHELWTKTRISILLKALKQYPAGTKSRYNIVTNYVNKHDGCNFEVKQIIHQVKMMTVNQETNVVKMVNTSSKSSSKTVANDVNGTSTYNTDEKTIEPPSSDKSNVTWSIEEQKIFQQALKSIPIGTVDRWGKISSLLPNKSSNDCQQRLKYLCEIIKKKKGNPTK